MLLYLVSMLALWSVSHGYYGYQTKIPNGQQVPHPCKPNFIWHGVGHLNPLGGGERNPFGIDFARLGHQWSVELCQLDSDGDGLTNGQELGDPSCVWREGDVPQQTDNITHPGVCDPWDSQMCGAKNSWVNCDVGDFKCDPIHEPDVRNITLRFPRSKVPTDETTYICFVFDLPTDEEYHLIATQPYIDNPNVMHHIVAYGCDHTAPLMAAPEKCNMGSMGCNTLLGLWTLGMTGECLNPAAGFRIGKGGSARVGLQFHWTNKHHVDHWYDSSGMTLYYTPRLRPNDAGVLTIGQAYLEIPPGEASLTTTGLCTSSCTRTYMNSSINVVSILNHMHYLGVHGNVEHIRDGRVIANLSMDNPYSYDSPQMHVYDNPVVVKPGDALKMICEFSSLSRDTTTVQGQGSFDEMCYGIITYYPKRNRGKLGSCIQWKDMDYCELSEVGYGCDLQQMLNTSSPETSGLIDEVLSKCGVYGSCRKECPAALAKVRRENSCLSGKVWEYVKFKVMEELQNAKLMKLVSAVEICDRQGNQSTVSTTTAPPMECKHSPQPTQAPSSGSESKPSAVYSFLEVVKALGTRPLLQNIIFNQDGK